MPIQNGNVGLALVRFLRELRTADVPAGLVQHIPQAIRGDLVSLRTAVQGVDATTFKVGLARIWYYSLTEDEREARNLPSLARIEEWLAE